MYLILCIYYHKRFHESSVNIYIISNHVVIIAELTRVSGSIKDLLRIVDKIKNAFKAALDLLFIFIYLISTKEVERFYNNHLMFLQNM